MINELYAYSYCCEDISLIENYNEAINDKTQTWVIHHKLEIELNKTRDELIYLYLYYQRPASELIFLTISEHRKLHNKAAKGPWNKGKKNIYSRETLEKMSKARKGKPSPTKGKHWIMTEEGKRNVSEAMKKWHKLRKEKN